QAHDKVGDDAFAVALQEAGNVLLFARSQRRTENPGEQIFADHHNLIQPYEPFARAALDTAPMILPEVLPSHPQVSWFFVCHPSLQYYVTLPMRAHQLLANEQGEPVKSCSLDEAPDDVQARSRLYNFYGPPRTVFTINYAKLLKHPEDLADRMRGAVVFVGYSAREQLDQQDRFFTVFTNAAGLSLSGVELAATAFANLQDHSWLRPLPWYGTLLVVVGYGFVCFVCARRFPLAMAALLIGGLAMVSSMICLYCFTRYYIWLPWFNGVLVQTPLAMILGICLRGQELHRQKSILQHTFGKYIPANEIDSLITRQELSDTQNINNSLCLVTDAQGYSKLSESLSPMALSELMQEYYAAVIEPIRNGGGFISDVAGDGVIALWFHQDLEKAWVRVMAVIATLLQSVDRFNAAHPHQALPTRVGVHAGEIALGHFGAADHYEYRAMGDLINSTSRLEGLNKQIGTRILISEDCLFKPDDSVRCVGCFKFVGKDIPLRLYTLVEQEPIELVRGFAVALNHFESGRCQRAAQQFYALSQRFPQDGPSRFFARYLCESRCEGLDQQEYWQKGIVF
ncbi:MAG: adenylate/guanylate cyclase domain-containing protein, partial [Gammaproteobacteria bacterium]